jgi:hypothetical protein
MLTFGNEEIVFLFQIREKRDIFLPDCSTLCKGLLVPM